MGFKSLLALAVLTAGIIARAQDAGKHPEKAVETAKTEAAKPGLNYKGINIQLGGFLASEIVYRSNNMADDIATAYARVPFGSDYGYGESEFRGTERQSRISLLATGDVSETTHISGYYETDFLGTSPTSNPNQSNSYTLRSRNVYGAVDWDDLGLHILAGQNWSLVTPNTKGITPRQENIPQTIDAQYVVGFDWSRQWQMRVVKDWDKKWWLAFSIENAQTVGVVPKPTTTTFNLPAGHLMAQSLATPSLDSYPDFILKGGLESTYGHYELGAIATNIESRYGTTSTTEINKQSVWAEGFFAGVTLPIWEKKLDLSISGLYGRGLARYGTSQLPDATVNSDGSLAPLDTANYMAALSYHIDPKWEAYLAYGNEYVAGHSDNGVGYGDGMVADNSTCGTTGSITCTPQIKNVSQINAAAWWTFYKGSFGAAKLGLEASYTWVYAYADKAGDAPNTNLTALYTSLRYYPF